MKLIEHLVFAVAMVAFVGIGIYSVGFTYYMLSAVGGPRRTRREMLALIPPRLRYFGYWSIGTFLGCLALLALVTLIRGVS